MSPPLVDELEAAIPPLNGTVRCARVQVIAEDREGEDVEGMRVECSDAGQCVKVPNLRKTKRPKDELISGQSFA